MAEHGPRTSCQPNGPQLRLRDMGQATPLVALLFAVVAGAILLLAQLGAIAADRAQARTAADAAALAGAADGETAARSVAVANHAGLESFVQQGEDVEVTVRVDRARASARARRRWVTMQPGAPR